MYCPFLMVTGRGASCELFLEGKCIGDHRVAFVWLCKHGWKEHCSHFRSCVSEDGPEDEVGGEHILNFPALPLRHLNRIGGVRSLQLD